MEVKVHIALWPGLKTLRTSLCKARRKEARFTLLKGEGNDLVRRGCFQEALQKYSDCLTLKPEECALYTNRYYQTTINWACLSHCGVIVLLLTLLSWRLPTRPQSHLLPQTEPVSRGQTGLWFRSAAGAEQQEGLLQTGSGAQGFTGAFGLLFSKRFLLTVLLHDFSFCGRTTCQPAATSRKSSSWTPTCRRPSRSWRRWRVYWDKAWWKTVTKNHQRWNLIDLTHK